MAHLQLVKVQPQVFTAKCSEPQVEDSDVQMKAGANKSSEPTRIPGAPAGDVFI